MTLQAANVFAQDTPSGDSPSAVSAITLTGDALTDLQQISGTDAEQIRVLPRLYPAIAPTDVKRYAQWLNLSEAQQAYAWAMYGDYRDVYSKAIRDRLPTLIARSKEVERTLTQLSVFSPEYLKAEREFEPVVDEINSRCERLAAEFFARIKSVLAEVQLGQCWRVELDHARRHTSFVDREHRPARVDLEMIVERMVLDPETTLLIEPILIDYEKRVTPLIVDLEKSFVGREIPLAEAWFRLNLDNEGRQLDLGQAEDRGIQQQNFGRIQGILLPAAKIQEAILNVNKDFVPRFAAALPSNKSAEFLKAYREWAYANVYPDKCDPTIVYEGIMSSRRMSAEVQNAVATEWNRYRTRYEKICKDMEDESDRYYFQRAATDGGSSDNPKMRKWRDDRWELDERVLKSIRELLPAETLVIFQRQFDMLEVHMNSVRQSASIDRFP